MTPFRVKSEQIPVSDGWTWMYFVVSSVFCTATTDDEQRSF